MSDASQEPREWRFYVNDMIEFAEKVQLFTDGMDQDTFVSNALTYDATLRNEVQDDQLRGGPPWAALDFSICGTRQPCFTWANEFSDLRPVPAEA